MILDLLTPYWLPALLALSGAVTVIGIFVNQVQLRNYIEAVDDDAFRAKSMATKITIDFHDLNEKFKALDKPSNDKALENIAVILKKKISKQPTKLIRPRTLKKANGARRAHR